jgi:hypothetical protein
MERGKPVGADESRAGTEWTTCPYSRSTTATTLLLVVLCTTAHVMYSYHCTFVCSECTASTNLKGQLERNLTLPSPVNLLRYILWQPDRPPSFTNSASHRDRGGRKQIIWVSYRAGLLPKWLQSKVAKFRSSSYKWKIQNLKNAEQHLNAVIQWIISPNQHKAQNWLRSTTLYVKTWMQLSDG